MKIGIPKEAEANEKRVAATPDTVERLKALGFSVAVERGAGESAHFPDSAYESVGAEMVDTKTAWSQPVVLKINSPQHSPLASGHEADLLTSGQTLICMVFPGQNEDLVKQLSARGINLIAMDCIPRISRAQKMDVLSSMANIAGYRAVLEAAHLYGSFFGGQMTAAGKVPPARFLIIGAGVAGLSAIAAARGLGAVVGAFDTRLATKDQVKSLGANFLELEFEESGEGSGGYAKTMSKEFIDAEMALFAEQAREVDVIVTTALIPGKTAPVLITREMVESMKPGSVIVDLAAPQGGNCEMTQPESLHVHQGVFIVGYTDLTSRMPRVSSQFFGTNLCHLLSDMGGAEEWRIDLEDEVVRAALILHEGEIVWPPPPVPEPSPPPAAATEEKKADSLPPSKKKSREVTPAPSSPQPTKESKLPLLSALIAGGLLFALGRSAPPDFLQHLTVFVLACFVGWQVIWNVKPALHTPLMSVTNAISGIIVIGGLIQAASLPGEIQAPAVALGLIAILFATINVAGGFLVTQRMLQMFRK